MSSNATWVKICYILLAILYCFTGAYFIMYPGISAYSLGMVIGIMSIIYGVIIIGAYFLAVNFKSIWALLVGICLVVIGIIVLSNISGSVQIIATVVGIGYILVGAYKTIQSFSLKDLGISTWWLALILGILTIVVGCILAFNPANGAYLAILVGASLLVNGVSDLMLGFMAF